ncbi:MAG TPA: M23 family metallopeptidase [Bacteroidales bacterium]|nr:M23 family metallopeptidase [Bacteroidales bacterium]
MSKIFYIGFLVFLMSCSIKSGNSNEEATINKVPHNISDDPCCSFNDLNTKIRDGKIKQDSAVILFKNLIPQIRSLYYSKGGTDFNSGFWIFPVQGYSESSIGGTNGSGYIADHYNYFDGNKHKGHPAHDIFIFDRNQDCLDDRSGKQVNVLSISGGIVIAVENQWDTLSDLRGGKYIWIYEPISNSLFYYAHNSEIFVHLGDLVKPGDTISTVGRTGLNAHKKRSPTHLHLMQLGIDGNFCPIHINCYESLIKS